MARCPNCSYELVLLQRNQKCKCALCGKLYPRKEIEAREFRDLNRRGRIADIENLERERKERAAETRELKKAMGYLFNGLPKGPIAYSKAYYRQKKREWKLNHRAEDLKAKQEYYLKNKQIINQKDKIRRQANREEYNQKNTKWRKNNREMMRAYGMIQHYRSKQKALALLYLINDEHSPSTTQIFHSVSTNSLSHLLHKTIIL